MIDSIGFTMYKDVPLEELLAALGAIEAPLLVYTRRDICYHLRYLLRKCHNFPAERPCTIECRECIFYSNTPVEFYYRLLTAVEHVKALIEAKAVYKVKLRKF